MFESVPDDIESKIERYGTATIDLILDETGLDTLYPVHVLLEAYENRVAAVIDRFQVFFDWKPPGLNAEAMRCSVTLSREPVLAAPLHVREATGGGGELRASCPIFAPMDTCRNTIVVPLGSFCRLAAAKKASCVDAVAPPAVYRCSH